MFRDAILVGEKDLRIERRSRVTTQQVLPFGVLVLVLFAFAFDADVSDPQTVVRRVAPGLFWVAVLFASLLGTQRSFAVETDDRAIDALRLSGLDPAGIFIGKAGAVAIQLLVLEVHLGFGVLVLYDTHLMRSGLVVLVLTCLLATVGLAAAGSLYGVLVSGVRGSETLMPLLYLPVCAPVLLAATRATEAALGVTDVGGVGAAWPWVRLLLVFAVIYVAFGIIAFGSMLEES